MPSSPENKTAACEQCGAPLPNLGETKGCLHCLLSMGIDDETAGGEISPNESVNRIYQHYEILSRPDGSLWELGRGAMGVTYKARHINLETTVALKVINARFAARPEARQRFLHEAQAAAQLRHSNVASVFHFGTIEPRSTPLESQAEDPNTGDCFYVMEFVEGESLEERLRRTGPLSPELALEIGLQVARALAAAAGRGLVHRDLKPSNIMLLAEEEITAPAPAHGRNTGVSVKVIDFGLAKFADEENPSPADGFLGTPAFASPEQKEARKVDGRSDIYSLGATLWYALTGELLNDGSGDILPVARILEREVPSSIIAVLKSMLALDPNDRVASASELVGLLEKYFDALTEAPHSSRERARRWAMAAGLSLTAVLIALASYFFAFSTVDEDKSIAVLPFRNLSNDPNNSFFAEGVQDDILSRLVKIRDLKVIGRRGTPQELGNGVHDLRAIGRALRVQHLLEGSLRRSGDRVLLHVSLVIRATGERFGLKAMIADWPMRSTSKANWRAISRRHLRCG